MFDQGVAAAEAEAEASAASIREAEQHAELHRLLMVAAAGDQVLAGRLKSYLSAARGVASSNTTVSWISGIRRWVSFAAAQQSPALPAKWETIVEYVDHLAETCKYATIEIRIWAIARLHMAARLPSPTSIVDVKLAMRRVARSIGTAQSHARGAWLHHIAAMHVTSDQTTLRGLRDRAMTLLAYDLSARESELMALDLEDLARTPDGHGIATIRRSKTDQTGRGAKAYVARDTMDAIDAWCAAAAIHAGAIFRSVNRWGTVGRRLSPRALEYTAKRLAREAKLKDGYSGHSFRAGAAQEMIWHGIPVPPIMVAQRRQDERSLLPYLIDGEVEASAMAQLAVMQGRSANKRKRRPPV